MEHVIFIPRQNRWVLNLLPFACCSPPPFFSPKLSFLPSPQLLHVLSSGSLSKLLHLSYAPSSSHLPSQLNPKTSLSHSLLLQNISHSFLLCSLLKLPENFPLLTLSPSLSLCFLLHLLSVPPKKKATCYPKISLFLSSRICPSNHICRDSHLPTPLLCRLPKSTPPTARRPPHAAGFSPSNNSQKDFCLIPWWHVSTPDWPSKALLWFHDGQSGIDTWVLRSATLG